MIRMPSRLKLSPALAPAIRSEVERYAFTAIEPAPFTHVLAAGARTGSRPLRQAAYVVRGMPARRA
jgi:hypothetical protein